MGEPPRRPYGHAGAPLAAVDRPAAMPASYQRGVRTPDATAAHPAPGPARAPAAARVRDDDDRDWVAMVVRGLITVVGGMALTGMAMLMLLAIWAWL